VTARSFGLVEPLTLVHHDPAIGARKMCEIEIEHARARFLVRNLLAIQRRSLRAIVVGQ
jgi:hypothetical protein